MDGVLVFSEPMHYQAWLVVLRNLNLSATVLSPADIIGIDDTTVANQVRSENQLDISCDELVVFKQQAFIDKIPSGFPVPAGRNEFLDYFSDQVEMAVVSSSGREEVQNILKSEAIMDYFSFYHGGEDSDKHKPDPQPYLRALTRLGKQSSQTLIIEDSEAGVKSALASGCSVFTMNSPEVSAQYKVRNFNDYHEMLEYLM